MRALEPRASARLLDLDETRWGNLRIAPESDPLANPPGYSTGPRIAAWLEALFVRDAAGAELAPVLLNGLAASYGTTDLNNDELRIPVHWLPLVARRYRAFRQQALDVLRLRTHRPTPRTDGPDELLLIARSWALYRTYLDLRGRGESLTGAPGDESFQGIRRPDASPRDQHKAFTWYKLADLLFLGVQQRLMRLTLTEIADRLARAELEWAVETWAVGLIFGEGRSYQRITAATLTLLSPDAAERFEAAGLCLASMMEDQFRQSKAIDQIDPAPLRLALDRLASVWHPQLTPAASELEQRWLEQRQDALFQAERHLERVILARKERPSRADSQAWPTLERNLRGLLEAFAAGKLTWEGLAERHRGLREALDRTVAASRALEEHLHWPGDGEDYRARRQRCAAPADRYYHLIALGERLSLAINRFRMLNHDMASPPPWPRFQRLLEHDEACIFVEEWVAHYGPRIEAIFGGRPFEVSLPGNLRTREVDLIVRYLVEKARHFGGSERQWGWLFCGVTDLLRELVRRLGPDGTLVGALDALIGQRLVDDAAALIRATVAPGAEPADLDAYVTVGVHVFNASPKVVRENLLHNKHLSWPAERLWLLIGSSSANRLIAEQERAICLEAGATHYFLSARRHQKAGNQNRVMPNVPAHPRGKSFYLTLDDDYLAGSQTLHRLVPLAERHPRAAFVQLPLYLFGNEMLGISRARHADAAGMAVWGSVTSPGTRDLRLFPDSFANRRALALPFGTCTLFRLTPGAGSLEDTSGFYTDTVCEDFAQGLLAFSMKHLHYPRRPEAQWEDGILLDEIWIEGDGVELLGRIKQQTRWCEGSTRNAWKVWVPALRHGLKQRLGLIPQAEARPPGLAQLTGGSAVVFGYTLELLGMLLFMVGFPLTVFLAEPAPTLGHSFIFWAVLWGAHLAHSYYLAANCGISFRAFLDQHFIRFASITGLAEGIYRSVRSPSTTWSACKDPRARVSSTTTALFGVIASLNLTAAALGAAQGMHIYLLCLVSALTALWPFLLLKTVPVTVTERVRHLPRRPPVSAVAWRLFRREGQDPAANVTARPIPYALAATLLLLAVTVGSVAVRYGEMLPMLPHLLHQHPVFLTWLVASDLTQVLSLSWIWLFTLCGIRNRHLFTYDRMIEAGQAAEAPHWNPELEAHRAARLRPLGQALSWLTGRGQFKARAGFIAASGAWLMVLAVAIGLRIAHLNENGAFMDESFYIVVGRRFLQEGSFVPVAKVMFGSYLYPLLTALASQLGGLTGTRLLSALAGVVTVLSVGEIGHRLNGHRTGIVAALTAAVTYQAVYISALATYDATSVAGVALSAAFLVAALWSRPEALPDPGSRPEVRRERIRLLLLTGSSLALTFGILAKYVAIVFVPGMLLAVYAFSRREGLTGPSLWKRTAAWTAPVGLALATYILSNRALLEAWWSFSLSYKTLVSQSSEELVDIYLVQGWNIMAALALALWGAARFKDRPAVVFLFGQTAAFAAFQWMTRADFNYLKHINYALPFLLPLTGLGLVRVASWLSEQMRSHGLGQVTAASLAQGALCSVLLLLGLQEVDAVGGGLRWWTDLRPYAEVLQPALFDGDRVLTDEPALEWYTLARRVHVDTPFYTSFAGREGVPAAIEGLRRQAYDAVVLTGGSTPQGRTFGDIIGRELLRDGYIRLSGRSTSLADDLAEQPGRPDSPAAPLCTNLEARLAGASEPIATATPRQDRETGLEALSTGRLDQRLALFSARIASDTANGAARSTRGGPVGGIGGSAVGGIGGSAVGVAVGGTGRSAVGGTGEIAVGGTVGGTGGGSIGSADGIGADGTSGRVYGGFPGSLNGSGLVPGIYVPSRTLARFSGSPAASDPLHLGNARTPTSSPAPHFAVDSASSPADPVFVELAPTVR